jgi:hypothetical protein
MSRVLTGAPSFITATAEHLSEQDHFVRFIDRSQDRVLEVKKIAIIPGMHNSSYNGLVVLMGLVDIATDGKYYCISA